MNPQYIAIIISAAGVVVSIVLAVFSANWLSARHTDRLIEQLERRLTDRDGRLTAELQSVRSEIKAQGEVSGVRLDGIERRLTALEARLDRLDSVLFKPALPGRRD